MKTVATAVFCLLAAISCEPIPRSGGRVTIALSSDAQSLNPLFATGSNTSTVLQFLFAELASHRFDEIRGADSLIPSLARAWWWSEDRRSLTYRLHGNLLWSDSSRLTAEDIKSSFQLMDIGKAPRKNKLNRLLKNTDGTIDWKRAVIVRNDTTILFNFDSPYRREDQLDDTQIWFVPGRYFATMDAERLQSSGFNANPITSGPFKLKQWVAGQEIVLERNPLASTTAYLDEVVFRIIPDMTVRLVELRTGEVDVVEGLTPEQARGVMVDGSIRIEKQANRRMEYVGWSNIDPEAFARDKTIRPHRIFGDDRVRRALGMAINKKSLTDAALGGYGSQAHGPISPAFRWAINDTLEPLPYDPEGARRLLAEAGWSDRDGDGVLDKDGEKFEFTLTTNSGNDRRVFALERIRAELENMGILVRTQLLETNTFNSGLRSRRFDAFIAGQVVSLGVDLENQFGSDLSRNTFNVVGFSDSRVDSLLTAAAGRWQLTESAPELREMQAIIHQRQPVTFLYWYDNLIAVRNRLKGTRVSTLSPYDDFNSWYVTD